MTRSTLLRWVWFVVCAALAVAAGCSSPTLQLDGEVRVHVWVAAPALEVADADPEDAPAPTALTRVVDEWPTPAEWASREARGLAPRKASAPERQPARRDRASDAADHRRRPGGCVRAKITRAPTRTHVRGEVVTARPVAAQERPAAAPAVSRPHRRSEPLVVPPPVTRPGRVLTRGEEAAMLVAIVALAVGTLAVPFFLSRRPREAVR